MADTQKKGAVTKRNSALVIGAGIGGIKAAMDLAESGLDVHLIEDAPFIGGTLSQLDSQFPTNDCGMCQMLPSFGGELCADMCLRRGLAHPNINIITHAELKSLKGEVGSFKALIKKKARYVDLEKCIACNLCVDVCPVEVPSKFNEQLDMRKAIYIRYPSAAPSAYAVDAENCNQCGECVNICPTKAIDLSGQDKEAELDVGAVILALGFTPFDPGEIGAYHYNEYQNVVTALELERIISGTGPNMDRELLRASDNKPPQSMAFIQCVGSRDDQRNYCSYACCMHSLKEAMLVKELLPDIHITIFFMDMRVFGKGYYTYFEDAKKMGIEFVRCKAANIEEEDDKNLRVNFAVESDEPGHETFDMVVLASGQNPPRSAKALSKVLDIELDRFGFCALRTGSPVKTSRQGVFACGSFSGPKDIPDTITQAAAAAANVISLMRQGKGELVRALDEQDKVDTAAEKVGIGIFVCGCGDILSKGIDMDDILKGARALPDVTLVEHINYLCLDLEAITQKVSDANLGKVIICACSPYPYEIKFIKALAAAGIDSNLFSLVNIREECAWVHEDKLKATEKAKAQIAMANEKLRGQEKLKVSTNNVVPKALVIGGGISGMTAALRIANSGVAVDFVEKSNELGGNARDVYYTLDGLDVQIFLKEMVEEIIAHKLITVHKSSEVVHVSGEVGAFTAAIKTPSEEREDQYAAVIIATGANPYTPQEYLYGEHEGVITQTELESRLVVGNFKANTVVMIQCVGFMDESRPYCGRICCSSALKNALKIKELHPGVDVYVLHREIMTYGSGEEYYIKAKEKGVNFIRFEEHEKPEVKVENTRLKVQVKEQVLNEEISIEPDIVVLSIGPEPKDNTTLVKAFDCGLELNDDGFFCEANVKFRPVDLVTEGIFVCGLAHSPRNLVESIALAEACAARALTLLLKDKISSRSLISEVNEHWCVGCEACIKACPYGARVLDLDKKIAKVVDVLCQGCGTCAVVCPSSATKLRGYKDKQIMAMIDAAVI